jgi:site-specific DNA-methyltransferase (adenine-specific)/site-specific DNA-methyltransferase (cytosine-N4-specific)
LCTTCTLVQIRRFRHPRLHLRPEGRGFTRKADKNRDNSKVGSGFGKNISNWLSREKAYPANVLHLATECSNKKHSAAFPEELPEWFIKLFTKEQDTVLDPFMGSGTTLIVANRMKRNSIGIDIVSEYCEMVQEQLNPVELCLFEPKPNSIHEKLESRGHLTVR